MPTFPRIFIATPCFGAQVCASYVASLLPLHTALTVAGAEPVISFNSDPACPRARNDMAAQFLASDCDALMFIDADISFRPDDVAVLVGSGLDVVAGAYPRKSPAGGFILSLHEEHVREKKIPIVTVGPHTFIEVKDVGAGFLCIRRPVLEKMIEAYPEIAYSNDEITEERGRGAKCWDFFSMGVDGGRYLSEDYFFCRRWQRLGGKVYVHLGAKLQHTGPQVFTGDLEAWLRQVVGSS